MGNEYIKPYENILSNYNSLYGGDMPSYQRGLNQIGQVGARSRAQNERSAISSNTLAAANNASQQNELDAIMNYNLKNERFKLEGADKRAGATMALAGQKEKQFNINEWYPNQIALNQYGEMWKGGQEGVSSGLNALGSIGADLAGTRFMQEYLNKLQT